MKEKKVLKIMKTKKKKLLNSGYYEKEKFETDLDRIKAFYYQKGYIDIKILGVEEKYIENNKKVIIDIKISEGKQYTIGDIIIEGNTKFTNEVLLEYKKLKKGEIYIPEDLSKDVKLIKNYYLRAGYIDVKVGVKPHLATDKDYVLDFKYTIIENKISFIDKIKIIGNNKTKDIVIRRELNLDPGEKFDGVKMDIASKRLQNLGLFKTVEIYPDPTQTEKERDLLVELEEDKTGELSFGAGYSSVDHLIGFLEVSQSNFDIFNYPSFTGDAQKLKLRSEFGKNKQEFLIDFTEPWLFEKRLLFGLKLFTTSREYDTSDFSEERNGFLLRLAKPIFRYSRGEVRYSFENVNVKNVTDTASEYLQAQEGERNVGKIGFGIKRDVRDSYFNATRGSKLSLDFEVAGLGGEIHYHRTILNTDLYFNPIYNNVLIASLKIGAIERYGDTEEIPIFDRFFLGGAWSLRGFEYRDVGPHDELGEPLGGKFMYYGTFEYIIPLVEQFKFATFLDYGNLYADFDDIDLDIINASIGIGLRIMIDARIPLRFDYAWPIETDEFHDGEGEKFTFDIGHRF